MGKCGRKSREREVALGRGWSDPLKASQLDFFDCCDSFVFHPLGISVFDPLRAGEGGTSGAIGFRFLL